MGKTKTPAEQGFTPADRPRLAQAMRTAKDVRVYRRAQALLWLAEGHPLRQVVAMSGAGRRTVEIWRRWYLQSHGVEDLADDPRCGRPSSHHLVSDDQLIQEFNQDPLELGYASTVWTVPLLAGHLRRRYDCSLSEHTVRRRLHDLGLVWKRPRYVYSQKDPHRTQKKGALCGV